MTEAKSSTPRTRQALVTIALSIVGAVGAVVFERVFRISPEHSYSWMFFGALAVIQVLSRSRQMGRPPGRWLTLLVTLLLAAVGGAAAILAQRDLRLFLIGIGILAFIILAETWADRRRSRREKAAPEKEPEPAQAS